MQKWIIQIPEESMGKFLYNLDVNKGFLKSESVSCSVLSDSLWPHGLCEPTGLFCPWILWARILEWVTISSSRGSSWPRDLTCVSCIAGRFFIIWTTKDICVIESLTNWASTHHLQLNPEDREKQEHSMSTLTKLRHGLDALLRMFQRQEKAF